jgi:hypothetical protein
MKATVPPAEIKRLFSTSELPELGPGPRAGVWTSERIDAAIEGTHSGASHPAGRGQLVRALVLLWHDHLDRAHTIVQDDPSAEGSYIHAILHRREPDFSNAKYWFRRVGQHPCYAELAARGVAEFDAGRESSLAERLIPKGRWDAFAFVDACETAGTSSDPKRTQLLRKLQQIEFETLLEFLWRAG